MTPLEIIYQDKQYVAVNKPSGLLIHRSNISKDKVFLLQLLRNQLQRRIYPVHRLDRGTSGVIIFAFSSEAAQKLASDFQERKIEKKYITIVRGYCEEEEIIDYPLIKENRKEKQEAISHYKKIAQVEVPIPSSKHPTSRFSLLEISPKTGRRHQLRKHLAHIFHPIIGDTTHGDGKQNTIFRDNFNSSSLLLHSYLLQFRHPYTKEDILIKAPLRNEFIELFKIFNWNL